ncbi:hypothetical protein EVAR_6729_1 [Eumeta japonica]|uniref:Uncharacterized protein n=1 Tax=Eumeta variegata TaxID=151549 RepID=A0A4C1V3M5_EUMVA|nr:hypothetical protein EVAR_6729_1 [Eumeta japonica]
MMGTSRGPNHTKNDVTRWVIYGGPRRSQVGGRTLSKHPEDILKACKPSAKIIKLTITDQSQELKACGTRDAIWPEFMVEYSGRR